MSDYDRQRVGRLVFVATTRARERAGFLLPTGVTGYFRAIAQLR